MTKRYQTPKKGSKDWHIPLNNNFIKLDTDVEIRDIESNLKQYSPEQGAKFFAIDTGRRYIGTGSEWTDATLSAPTVSADPSSPAEGQFWYNTSDGALRINTSKGPVDIVSVGGESDGSGGREGDNTYYDGKKLATSEYGGIQAAVDAASAKDVISVDADETVSSVVALKSDIKIEGAGGVITAADGSSKDMLRPGEVSNVWIDGIHLDGGWEGPNGDGGNVGTRCIGGVNVGPVDNIRITNCTIENSGLNAVNFVDKNGDEMTDIYIANNTIRNSRNHGILLGVRDENGSGGLVENLLIRGNQVDDSYDAQAIGCFGQDGGVARNCAIVDNMIDQRGGVDPSGANIALEEEVENCIVYANTILGDPNASRGGPNITKDGRNCILGNNYVKDCARSIVVKNHSYYEPDGPPRYSLVIKNEVVDGSDGFFYSDLDGDLHVSDNCFTNCNKGITDGGSNTGTNYTFYNNGPSVSSAKVGIPDNVGTSVTYTDEDGNTIGSGTWSAGSVDPSNPVSVSVSASI